MTPAIRAESLVRARMETGLAGLGVGLLAAQSLGLFGGACPSIFAPASFPLVLGYWNWLGPFVVAVPVLVFCLWNLHLLRGDERLPMRSLVLGLLIATGSVAWFVTGWSLGLKYEGAAYTVFCAFASGAWALVSTALAVVARARPSFRLNLLASVSLFLWAVSYAFPYLGEVP